MKSRSGFPPYPGSPALGSTRGTGFTLLEVLVAAIVGAIVVAAGMMAFVSASRMTRTKNLPGESEAAGYAQQTIEKYRNYIACDTAWFNATTCAPTAAMPTTAWTDDPLPLASTLPASSTSILKLGTAKRCFRVALGQPPNCVADASSPLACYDIEAQVCWDTDATCTCP